ncbi:hypothetical protein [Peribacillus deserti]|uniref:hypothetical protein n=1 Tax=Peribacillus deserti TaxID=673318 RepID=UPI0015E0CECD|nr:hypothetical protein [Peribacillus deserti]
MTFLIVLILVIIGFAILIDWKRKKNRNSIQHSINPHAKAGEDSNYTIGDNRYSGGGH